MRTLSDFVVGASALSMRSAPVLVLAIVLGVSPLAKADVFASVTTLDPSGRLQLEASISSARGRDSGAFDVVGSVVARADALDRQKHGRFYPMSALLREATRGRTGATLALLEPLLAPQRFVLPQTPSALIALRAGLIEAAGDGKELAAAPVFRAIVTSGSEFFEVRAAAEALGKLGLDADVTLLSRLATTPGPNQHAVIAGLGSCRRIGAAQALQTAVAQRPSGMMAKDTARSLSIMGSAWTLAIPNAAPASEVQAIRETTARAALAMFISTSEPDVRVDASNALVVIAAPEAVRLIASAKGVASPELAASLDALSNRLAHNPTSITRAP
jgi:hypothetical protein